MSNSIDTARKWFENLGGEAPDAWTRQLSDSGWLGPAALGLGGLGAYGLYSAFGSDDEEDEEKQAAACAKAPRYSMTHKTGKKAMPQPHNRRLKKLTKKADVVQFATSFAERG